jgi:hypothetical protein
MIIKFNPSRALLSCTGGFLMNFIIKFSCFQYLKTGQKFGATYFKINEEMECLEEIQSKGLKRIYKIGTIFNQVYALAMFYHLLFGNLTILGKLQGIPVLIIYTFTALIRTGWNLSSEPLHVINTFLEFERKLLVSG